MNLFVVSELTIKQRLKLQLYRRISTAVICAESLYYVPDLYVNQNLKIYVFSCVYRLSLTTRNYINR